MIFMTRWNIRIVWGVEREREREMADKRVKLEKTSGEKKIFFDPFSIHVVSFPSPKSILTDDIENKSELL